MNRIEMMSEDVFFYKFTRALVAAAVMANPKLCTASTEDVVEIAEDIAYGFWQTDNGQAE